MKTSVAFLLAIVLVAFSSLQATADIVVTASQEATGVRFLGSGTLNTDSLTLGGSDFFFQQGVNTAFPAINMGDILTSNGRGYEVTGPAAFGATNAFFSATTHFGNSFSLIKGDNGKLYTVVQNSYASGAALSSNIFIGGANMAGIGITAPFQNQTFTWNFTNGETFKLITQDGLGGPSVPEPGSMLVSMLLVGGFMSNIRRR